MVIPHAGCLGTHFFPSLSHTKVEWQPPHEIKCKMKKKMSVQGLVVDIHRFYSLFSSVTWPVLIPCLGWFCMTL